MYRTKIKVAELMEKVEYLENKQLNQRLMTEEILAKVRSSQFHKSIQYKMAGEESTPKKRAIVTSKKNGDTCSSK